MRAAIHVAGTILEALQLLVPGASKRTLRQMLNQGRVCVNGKPCKVAVQEVGAGDVVEIGERKTPPTLPKDLAIIFEDEAILIIHKSAGLLTVATTNEKERTAYAYLSRYLSEHKSGRKLFVVHRLDKFASGLLVFAKSAKVKKKLQDIFLKHDIQRKYWAIVEGRVERNRGTIRSHLAPDRSLRMHSTLDRRVGKSAITHYRVLRRFSDITTLEVTLETGRKNQIRAHLSELGHPIVGDRSYGSTKDPLGRLGLHAFHLGFVHPTRGVPVQYQTEPPQEFRPYLPR